MFSEPDGAGSSAAPPVSNPFPPDLVSDACISEVLPENKETFQEGWVDMRQMEPNNAGDSQASAGLQCWLRFKSLLLANWEREGASEP